MFSLCAAVSDDRQDLVHAMLADAKIDPNVPDEYNDTPLHIAVFKNNVNLVKLLLADPRVNPNSVAESGMTPLHFAAEYGRVGPAEVLIADPRVDVNARDKYGCTPLIRCCFEDYEGEAHDRLAVFRLLIADPRIDVNAQDDDGTTALHASVESEEKTFTLLDHPDIKPNTPNGDGAYPMVRALTNNRPAIVHRYLRHPDIDPNVKCALFVAVYLSESSIITELLAHPKIDVNQQEYHGETALHMAATYSYKYIEQLLSHPLMDYTIKNERGNTAFAAHILERGIPPKPEVVELFLKYGAHTEEDLVTLKTKYPDVWNQYRSC